jgi:hypothetical protein
MNVVIDKIFNLINKDHYSDHSHLPFLDLSEHLCKFNYFHKMCDPDWIKFAFERSNTINNVNNERSSIQKNINKLFAQVFPDAF